MPLTRADAQHRHPRHQRRGEARLPAVVATLTAVGLYLLLPEQLLLAPRYVLPALEVVLLVPLVAINPRRLTRHFRVLSLTLVAIIAVSNLAALATLIQQLVQAGVKDGPALLTSLLVIARAVSVLH